MMKHLLATAVVAGLTLAVAAPTSSVEAQDGTKVVTVKKHKRHVARHVVVRRRSAYPALEPYRSFGFRGEFPGSCAYDRAAGNCMIDLGYGRCVPCSQGGGGGRF